MQRGWFGGNIGMREALEKMKRKEKRSEKSERKYFLSITLHENALHDRETTARSVAHAKLSFPIWKTITYTKVGELGRGLD